jgi:hypothetical protein
MVLFSGFSSLFQWMESYNMMDALLPFLLIFTLVYATLQKTKIIGTGEKKYNVIVAFIMAFITVLPHITGTYPAHADIVNIINGALPNISVTIIAMISLLLLIGVFAPVNMAGTMLGGFFVFISIVAVIFFFLQAAGWMPSINSPQWSFLNDPDTQAVIIILVVFGFVLWFITREDKGTNITGGLGKFFQTFRDAITPK